MPDPGFTRSDVCSMRAVASRAHRAGAPRGVLSADGRPLAADGGLASMRHDVARILGARGAWLVSGHRCRRTGAGR